MKVVDYREGDWDALEARPEDVIVIRDGSGSGGYMLTILDGDTVMAVAGCVMPYEGLGYVWARVSPRAQGKGYALSRAVLRAIERVRVTLPLRQIRAQVFRSQPGYMDWIEMLGFELESYKFGAAPDGGDLAEYVLCMTEKSPLSLKRCRRWTTRRCMRTTAPGKATSPRDASLRLVSSI